MTNSGAPNIVVVMSDDHGRWATGCYGNGDVLTPAIDYLATTGTRFDHAFTPSPVCSPARASFWTGRLPSQHGIHDFLDGTFGEAPWLGSEITLARLLKDHGYATGLSGKWHAGQERRPADGFDYWYSQSLKTADPFAMWTALAGTDPLPPALAEAARPPMDHVLGTQQGYDPNAITDHAVDFLRRRPKDTPFFLFVGYIATHSFWSGHPEYLVDMYRRRGFADVTAGAPYSIARPVVEATFVSPENRHEALAQYYAAVTEVDRGVARILDEVATQSLTDDTVVVYTSDHGCLFGHHDLWGKGNATRPLNALDESIRIPLVIHAPDSTPQQVNTDLVDHTDLFQTLLDLAGIQISTAEAERRRYPGRSFRPALLGLESTHARDAVFAEYGRLRMIRTLRYKLVRRHPAGPDELYDLQADPAELSNLADDVRAAAVREQLEARLAAHFETYEDAGKSGLLVAELPQHNREEEWRDLPP